MPSFHQMGNDSTNLLFQGELAGFAGAIISPVNETHSQAGALIQRVRRDLPGKELIFDPQLYFPQSGRGQLRSWKHFPSDVDTADLSSVRWWSSSIDLLAEVVDELGPDAVCSPTIVPRVFSNNDFYTRMIEVGNELANKVSGHSVLQTLVVSLDDLTVGSRAHELASIASAAETNRIFLVIISEIDPRRELNDPEGLKGVMRLISLLEGGGQQVLVGFCSTDMALWKAAGATSCATGKFFNLRRFTRSRFEEPTEGGRQLPYWCEESLMAYLRESDVARVQRAGGLSQSSIDNPFSAQILEAISTARPWLGLAWRHYLWWFESFERVATRPTVGDRLKQADDLWKQYDTAGSPLMEERQNDGTWVRQWRRAVAEFDMP